MRDTTEEQRRIMKHLKANMGPIYGKAETEPATTTQTVWGPAWLMTGVFIVLRVAGQIDWVWWALLMPVLLLVAVAVFALIGMKLYEWTEQ